MDLIERQTAIDAHCELCPDKDKCNHVDLCPDVEVFNLLPSALPEQRWIPCSERLPEESGEYLCTLVGVHNTGLPSECGYEPPNNHGITPGWSTCEADGFKFLRDDEVLAWMPLPESYKGEDQWGY